MVNWDDKMIREPVKIRGHHLQNLPSFVALGCSEQEWKARRYGSNPEKNNFNGYGEGFFANEVAVLGYIVKNPNARVKVTTAYDAICAKCPKRPCRRETRRLNMELARFTGVPIPPGAARIDAQSAEEYGIEPGTEYRAQDLLEHLLNVETNRFSLLQGV